jgi:hypothetical protein
MRREVIAGAPAEVGMCLDWRRLRCTEDEFQACPARKARAAELRAGRTAVPPR